MQLNGFVTVTWKSAKAVLGPATIGQRGTENSDFAALSMFQSSPGPCAMNTAYCRSPSDKPEGSAVIWRDSSQLFDLSREVEVPVILRGLVLVLIL